MPQIRRISRFGFVNAYLVPEDDGLTVVDTMIFGSAKAIRAAGDRLGAPIVRERTYMADCRLAGAAGGGWFGAPFGVGGGPAACWVRASARAVCRAAPTCT